MSSNQSDFYSGNFARLIEDIQKIQDQSIQEKHNLAISKYILQGSSPLPVLDSIVASIKKDPSSNPDWVNHPSFSLLIYHICLYYFRTNDFEKCNSILKDFWSNHSKIEKIVLFCVSLLTIEVSIRDKDSPYIEQAFAFLANTFSNLESIVTLLVSKGFDSKLANQIANFSLNAKLRYSIYKKSSDANELKSIISAYSQVFDPKAKKTFPVSLCLPLSYAYFYLGDIAKCQSILEMADDPMQFGVLNNRGVIEIMAKRYSSALLHFAKALNSRYNNELVYPYHSIVYNLGLSLLMKQKPRSSFKYLHSVLPLMTRSPYIWLRLAESAVMFYKQRCNKIRKQIQYSPIVHKRYVTNMRTFYLLPLTNIKVFELDKKTTPNLDLNFAEKCVRNTILLCGENKSFAPIRRAAELLCSYICLELGDGRKAAEMGKLVSSDSSIDRNTQFLAKIYSVQGNIISHEIDEAYKILSRVLVENVNRKEKEQSLLQSLTYARILMKSPENDMKKIEQQLQKATENDPIKPEVVLTHIAFEIKRNHLNQAVHFINNYNNPKQE